MEDSPALEAARILVELTPRLGRMISGALETDPAVALSLRQYRLLERLTARPHRTGELASVSAVSQPTASAAVTSLENRGLVTRVPDPKDGRATLVTLTEAGEQVFSLARQRVLDRLAMVTDGMSAADAAALHRLQPVLTRGMDRTLEQLRSQKV